MWKTSVVCVGLLIAVHGAQPAFGQDQPMELMEYLPDPAALQPWEPEDEPRAAEGETLFMLINGAAEMYFEYGFHRAIFQSYIDGEGQWIDLEIYEMTDAAAAYGLQSIKQGRNGKAVDIGDAAYLEEYYLNFRKGRVQVSVVGEDSSEAALEAVMTIARAVEARIPGHGEVPELVRRITESGAAPRSSVYLAGPIGLSNELPIFLETLAGFAEGVSARYDDFTLVLLIYPSPEEAASRFEQTADALRHGVEHASADAQELAVVLDNGTPLTVKAVRQGLLMMFGENLQQAQHVSRTIEALLRE